MTKKLSPARLARLAADIAESNFAAAIDQVDAYDSLEHALDCYSENAVDTAVEEGIDRYLVLTAFQALVIAHTKGN